MVRAGIATADCLDFLDPGASGRADLVIGSPVYALKVKRYIGLDAKKAPPSDPMGWAAWMVKVTLAAARVSRGYVMWVVDSPRKDQAYVPAVEMLVCMLHECKELVLKTPLLWTKNGSPGGTKYPGHNYEHVVVCHLAGRDPIYCPEAIGTITKYNSGPARQRKPDGSRVVARQGVKKGGVSRPRDVLRFTVGGRNMGIVRPDTGRVDMLDDKLCTGEGEAPYPWKLAAYLVKGYSSPGSTVIDPFVGSGTSGSAAVALDRNFFGCDIRDSQADVAAKRIAYAYNLYHPGGPSLQVARE
jgi:hypothetical protein